MLSGQSIPRTTYLASYSIPVEGMDALQFLQHAQHHPRFLWQQHDFTLAGFGVTAELFAYGENRFKRIQQDAQDLFAEAIVAGNPPSWAGTKLFGGFAFRSDFVPDEAWANFYPAHFVLPHFQMVSRRGETWLTINTQVPSDSPIEDLQANLHDALLRLVADDVALTAQPQQRPQEIRYPLSYTEWEGILNASIQQMQEGVLNKVVLSRVAEITFSDAPNLLTSLAYLDQAYPECYRFLFEPVPHHAFLGATPELIVSVEQGNLFTMGLAGSIARGATPEHDQQLADQLLHDPKEAYEHQLVVEQIEARLRELGLPVVIDERQIMRLRNIQHLYTPIHATLRQHTILELLEVLHPTPALGGQPSALAMQLIRNLESVTRGWYAAPIGWFDAHGDGQFGVGIRSAVANNRRVWLYAGGGIVAKSRPQNEWNETALKFKPMLNAFGAGDYAQ